MKSEPNAYPRYRWQVVAMLWFICFFNYADRQAVTAIFPLLKAEFGFSLGHKDVGALVNIEVDVLAKYVERLLAFRS